MKFIVNHALLILSLASLQVSAAATCNASISESTPTTQFTINTDGTVTDNKTGLMWMRCNLGDSWDGSACDNSAVQFDWENALITAEAYNSGADGYGSYSDWRLPNIKELASIAEDACYDPAINETLFLGTRTDFGYWSASSNYNSFNQAITIKFSDGIDFSISKGQPSYYVRLVRSGH